MNTKIEAILVRFPNYSEKITKQMEDNQDFESLCEDYGLCMNMLKALEKDAETKHARLEEYLEIKIELEQELLKYLH